MPDSTSDGVFGVLERVTDAGQSLSFVASLVGAVDGVDLRVASLGGRVVIECESVRAFVRLAREKQSRFPALSRTLTTTGTTAHVRVDGHTVALLGAGVSPGLLASRFGYGRTRLDARGIAVTLARTPARWRRRGTLGRWRDRLDPRR